MEKRKLLYYDIIRVLSSIFVIGIHSTDPALDNAIYLSWQWFFTIIFQIIVRTAVPLFIMLSGALILNSKDETISTFYLKRFSKIIIPLIIYSLFYLYIFKYGLGLFKFQILGIALKEIFEGPVFYHLWFVYTILGIYIFAPFLKVMVKNLSDKMILNLVLIIVIVSVLFTYIPLLGVNIGINTVIFVGYIDYFIVGYFLNKDTSKIYYNKIILLGCISFALSLLISVKSNNYQSIIYGSSPTIILISSMFFMFFIKNKDIVKNNTLISNAITFVSRHTFSIYLIHIFVLQKLLYPIGINSMWNGVIIGTFITIILTFIISLIISVIVDTLIINQIISLFDKIVTLIKNPRKNDSYV
jgi:Uncharacterized protein conserved in bacteria